MAVSEHDLKGPYWFCYERLNKMTVGYSRGILLPKEALEKLNKAERGDTFQLVEGASE